MTRETKIGLLVSLAFVIAVGVLLSDHMVNNTDAKPLPVATVGPEVAKGLAMPGQPAQGVATPLEPAANPVPAQPVPSVADINPPAADPAKSTIAVGPGPTSEIEIAKATPNVPQRQTEIKITPAPEGLAVPAADPNTYVSTLTPGTPAPATPLAAPATTQPAEKSYQDYVAVKGDNVAKMAKHFLGADTKANRELIIAANDSLKKDPTKIVVGKTYRIPVKQAPAVAVTPTAPASGNPTLMATQTSEPASAPAAAPARTYVVKSGDNLWKIAKGNEKLMGEIRKLNRDVILKGDALKVGSTLRLPAKDAHL